MNEGKRANTNSRDSGRATASGRRDRKPSPELLRQAELEEEVARLARANLALEDCRERLREERDFLDQILESLPYPFYVIDAADYHVVRSNAAAQSERNGGMLTCYALTHGIRAPCGTSEQPCPLDEMRRTKAPVVVEHVHLSEQGVPFHAEIHAFPILDSNGELSRMVEYSIDISARKRAEAERERHVRDLEAALAKVRTLSGLLPICSSCKKIRDDQGYWRQVEEYILEHSDAEFSHSYCPECAEVTLRAHRSRK